MITIMLKGKDESRTVLKLRNHLFKWTTAKVRKNECNYHLPYWHSHYRVHALTSFAASTSAPRHRHCLYPHLTIVIHHPPPQTTDYNRRQYFHYRKQAQPLESCLPLQTRTSPRLPQPPWKTKHLRKFLHPRPPNLSLLVNPLILLTITEERIYSTIHLNSITTISSATSSLWPERSDVEGFSTLVHWRRRGRTLTDIQAVYTEGRMPWRNRRWRRC